MRPTKRDYHVVPAYGRDYTSMKAVHKDWLAGRDFRDSWTGCYLSRRDVESTPEIEVWVRYNKLQKMVRVQ
jgi:hypothetical protein